MPENAILLRCGIDPWSSCYVRERAWATNGKRSVDFAADALADPAGFRHIRTALLSQLRVRRDGSAALGKQRAVPRGIGERQNRPLPERLGCLSPRLTR